MKEMTHRHTRELDIFYKEHKTNCTICKQKFADGMCAHLGYLEDQTPAVLCDNCSEKLAETVVRYHWMHDEFVTPLPTEKLWRYMDLGKFISLISTQTLYFASASSFQDPFEGAKGVASNKGKWDSFYTDFLKHAISTAPGNEEKIFADGELNSEAERLLSDLNRSGVEKRKHTYISCWHCNNYESEAMWKLYSMNVTNAVAIQTTTKSLYEALDKNPRIDIGKINYIDYQHKFAPINGSFWYKRKAFAYEQEVRAILTDFKTKTSGLPINVNVDKLIEAIYISPYAPAWFESVVRSVAEKYGINKPIYYSEMTEAPFF